MFYALETKYLLSKKLRKSTQRGQSGTSWSSVILVHESFRKDHSKNRKYLDFQGFMFEGNQNIEQKESLDLQGWK